MTVRKSSLPCSQPAVHEIMQYVSYNKVSESFTITSISRTPSQTDATSADPAGCGSVAFAHGFHGIPNIPSPPPNSPPNVTTSLAPDALSMGLTPQSEPPTPHRGASSRSRGYSRTTCAVLCSICAPAIFDYLVHAVVFALLAGTSAFACASAGYVFLIAKEPYRCSNRDTVLCMSGIGGAAAGLAVFSFCTALDWVVNRNVWKRPDVPGIPGGTDRVARSIVPPGLLLAVAAGGLFGAYIGVRLPGGGLNGGLDEVHAFRLGAAGVMTVAEGVILLVVCPLYAYRSSWTC